MEKRGHIFLLSVFFLVVLGNDWGESCIDTGLALHVFFSFSYLFFLETKSISLFDGLNTKNTPKFW